MFLRQPEPPISWTGWEILEIWESNAGQCYRCGALTHTYVLAFECPICSPACMRWLDFQFMLVWMQWREGAD